MSYYYGAPHRGDYKTYGYAGDPGFLSGVLRFAKKAAAFIPGPVGTIAKVYGAVEAARQGAKMLAPPIRPTGQPCAFGYPSFPGVGTSPYAYGGPWTRTQRDAGSMQMMGPSPSTQPGGVCPTGYHLAKDGSGRLVRNRRMNIANPRALRRAMRRVQGFEKLAKRTVGFTRRTRLKKK